MKRLLCLSLFACFAATLFAASPRGQTLVIAANTGLDTIALPLNDRPIVMNTAPQWLADKRGGPGRQHSSIWRVKLEPVGEGVWIVSVEYTFLEASRAGVDLTHDATTLRIEDGHVSGGLGWASVRIESQ